MTGKRSRDKGAKYERKIAGYLNDRLELDASRRLEQYQTGGDDLRHRLEGWLSIETKDVAATSLGAWIDQSVEQAGERIALVVHHRRGNADPANDFATLPLRDLVALVAMIEYLTDHADIRNLEQIIAGRR